MYDDFTGLEVNLITPELAADIRARDAKLTEWLQSGKRYSYYPNELPPDIIPPNDEEWSSCEVFEFCNDPPIRYFLYIDQSKGLATTWTGEPLGRVSFGKEFRDNFGGKRIPVTIRAINGCVYHGYYFKSSGSYARVKMECERAMLRRLARETRKS